MSGIEIGVIALLLAGILCLLAPRPRRGLRTALERAPGLIWAAPLLLTAVFAGASALAGAFGPALTLLVLVYTMAPVCCAVWLPPSLDLVTVAVLWLPIEFAAGAALVPRPAQGFLHSVAYGIAILLGLAIFVGFRGLEGMKYNLPRRAGDLWLPLAAFALLAPVLIAIGVPIGFIPPPHWPAQSAGKMAAAAAMIYAGTALPEEILFRSLIQNLIERRWGKTERSLIAASVVFGAAHLDNGPQPLPNWRYMILATIAGYAYGKVFRRASTVLSSAGLHTLVDWTKHTFF